MLINIETLKIFATLLPILRPAIEKSKQNFVCNFCMMSVHT